MFWESSYDTIYYLNTAFEEVRKVCFNTGRKRISPEARINRKINLEKYHQVEMVRVLGSYIFFYLLYDKDAPLMYYNTNSNDNTAYLANEDFKCDTSYLAQYHIWVRQNLS